MKNKLLISIIFTIGIGLRLYSALRQPLWLDEIYSLYFANNFSALKLIFQPPEAHPGAYYLFLKYLLHISTNLPFLRIISSVIPSLIGIFLIYRQTHHKFLAAILLLNPFFIHMSWQLRMYGLTFMFSALLILSFLNSKHPFNHPKFLLISLLATLFSFSLIIPIFCLYLYLFFREKKIIIFLPFFLIILEFFITKGFLTYKKYAEYAAWISSPTFTNIPTAIATTLGFTTDIQNTGYATIFISILFFIIVIPVLYYLSKLNKLLLFSFTLPLLVTIIVSFSFPILSQRFFFYHFIPKISLFIPRFLLPLSLYFYLFISKLINKKYYSIILLILITLWIYPNYKLNYNAFYPETTPRSYSSDTLILPPWENLRLNSIFSHENLDKISHNFDIATAIENSLSKTSQNHDCTPLYQFKYISYIFDPSIKSMSSYNEKNRNILNFCCIESPSDSFLWQCPTLVKTPEY